MKKIRLVLSWFVAFAIVVNCVEPTISNVYAAEKASLGSATQVSNNNQRQEPTIEVKNLKADGVEVRSVDSQTKSVTASIRISNGEEQAWYYENSAGDHNTIDNLILNGAFEQAKLNKIEVDKDDLSLINFEIVNVPDIVTEDEGIITIPSANNVFGMALTAVIVIDFLDVSFYDTGITVDKADADSPSYTIKGMISGDGGSLNQKFNAGSISFDGAFKGSTIQGLSVDYDRKKFQVKISKDVNKDPNRELKGSLIIREGCVNYDVSKNAYLKPLKLTIFDDYVPKRVEGSGDGFVIDGISIIEQMVQQGLSGLSNLLNTLTGCGLFSFLNNKSIASCLFNHSDLKPSISESLDSINGKLDGISCQIDMATKEIIGSVNNATMLTYIGSVNERANHLDNNYYSYYNDNVFKALKWMEDGDAKGKETEIKRYLQTVYSSSDNNFSYLSDFKAFGNSIFGSGQIFTQKDIFNIFRGITTHTFDWNSETFEARKTFNDNLVVFFNQGYAALVSAIQYDQQLNLSDKNSMIYWIDEMQAMKEEQRINPADLKVINEQIIEYKKKLIICDDNLTQDEKQLNIMKDLRTNIDNSYKEAADQLQTEQDAKDKDGLIMSYRLNRNFDKNITSTHFLEKNDNDPLGIMRHLGYGENQLNLYKLGIGKADVSDNIGTKYQNNSFPCDVFNYVLIRNNYFGKEDDEYISRGGLTGAEFNTLHTYANYKSTTVIKELEDAGFDFGADILGIGLPDTLSETAWGSFGLASGRHFAKSINYINLDGTDSIKSKQFLEVWDSFWRDNTRFNFTGEKIGCLRKK